MNLGLLIWLSAFAGLAAFWWHSDFVKHQALRLVKQHCDRLGLQLLDHSMVIKGVWPVRGKDGTLQLRRRYRFEFSSTGERRYRGTVIMNGRHQVSIEMEPHVLPTQEQ